MNAPAAHTYEFPCALRTMTSRAFVALVRANGLHILKARTTHGPQHRLTYAAVVRRENRLTHLCSIWHVIGKGEAAIASPIAEEQYFYYPERTPSQDDVHYVNKEKKDRQ